MPPASCARACAAALCAALACASSSPVFSIGKHGGGHRHGHARRSGGGQAAYSGMHSLAPTTKNIGVSEKNIDGHVDDLVWVGKDSETMFLVRARARVRAARGVRRRKRRHARHACPRPPPHPPAPRRAAQLSSSKTLYRSLDGGKTWADQTDALAHLHSRKFGSEVRAHWRGRAAAAPRAARQPHCARPARLPLSRRPGCRRPRLLA
jgi:hypothetical protein